MRSIKLVLILALLLGFSFSDAETQYLPDQLNIDSLTASPLNSSPLSDIGSLTEMPTIDFPKEAEILVWWPDSNIDYKMLNALSPDQSGNKIEMLKGNKPKEKDKSAESNQ